MICMHMHVLYVHGMCTWMCICAYTNRLHASRLEYPVAFRTHSQGQSPGRVWDSEKRVGPILYVEPRASHTLSQTTLVFLSQPCWSPQLSTSMPAQAELGTHTEQQALAAMASSSIPGLAVLILTQGFHCPYPSAWPSLCE